MTHHLGPYGCREASCKRWVEMSPVDASQGNGKGVGWLDDGVGECSVVWSAVSLLKKAQHHLAFTVYFPVG